MKVTVGGAEKIDILIIGAGPAGLMLATWMARMNVSTRIIDKRFSPINSGQADGLNSRSFEILDSLGLAQDIWGEACNMQEICFWNPDENQNLYRSGRIPDTLPGISRFQQSTLHQARIEHHLESYIKKYSKIEVERGVMPESLVLERDPSEGDEEYPVSVILRHLPQEARPKTPPSFPDSPIANGLFRSNLIADTTDAVLSSARQSDNSWTETIRARYVVGCDGAHSWTRRQIGSVMEGENTDFIWGVLDIIPITNFPDIRHRCAIHSAFGSLMIIPRENKIVRLYIQITEVDATGTPMDRLKVNPENLFAAAQRILTPYTLNYKHCHWWTGYRIGQRIGSKFSLNERVFLAGDAVHTHSPKAGQGMNISMHDTYNLGWKLAHVIKGLAKPALLKTYDLERRQIAEELIEFDHKFSRLFSGRPPKNILDKEGIDLETFKAVFERGNLFASGCNVEYSGNIIVVKSLPPQGVIEEMAPLDPGNVSETTASIFSNQDLSNGIRIGMRIPSFKVLNQSDSRPWHLQELLPSNGSWRIVVFAGNIGDPTQLLRYEALGKSLGAEDSFLHRYNQRTVDCGLNPLFEVLTVHSASREEIELLSLPDVFHPFNEEYGWDYDKVFVDNESYHEGHGHAYENYGIDQETGCVVVVRPDQYVSWIGALEDAAVMDRFFTSILEA